MIKKLLKRIKCIGISANTEKDEIDFISFTNILIVMNSLVLISFTPYFIYFLPESAIYVIVVTLQVLLYATAITCNHFRLYQSGRNILCYTALVFTTIESVITNYYCDLHFFLLIGVIFAFFVFPEKQKKSRYLISILFTLMFFIIEINLAYTTPPPLPPYFIINIKYAIRLSLLFLLFFFAYYSYTTITGFQRNLWRDNIRMETEINFARNIQQQMIPSNSPADNIYSLYKPMNQVGGDFYDFITFPDSDKIGFFLSDVSGHGVPAAFITTIIKTAILQSGSEKNNPSVFLMYLNNILTQQSGGNFITAFYGIFDPSDRRLLFSKAGHNSPYLISPDGVTELKGGKSIPLAILSNDHLNMENKAYTNCEVVLTENSKLLLYTDGLVETRSYINNKIFFENAGMQKLFLDYKELKCKDFVINIYRDLVDFNGSENFEDDICMICVDIV